MSETEFDKARNKMRQNSVRIQKYIDLVREGQEFVGYNKTSDNVLKRLYDLELAFADEVFEWGISQTSDFFHRVINFSKVNDFDERILLVDMNYFYIYDVYIRSYLLYRTGNLSEAKACAKGIFLFFLACKLDKKKPIIAWLLIQTLKKIKMPLINLNIDINCFINIAVDQVFFHEIAHLINDTNDTDSIESYIQIFKIFEDVLNGKRDAIMLEFPNEGSVPKQTYIKNWFFPPTKGRSYSNLKHKRIKEEVVNDFYSYMMILELEQNSLSYGISETTCVTLHLNQHFRNALSMLSSFSEMIKNGQQDSPKILNYGEIIIRNSALSIISTFLKERETYCKCEDKALDETYVGFVKMLSSVLSETSDKLNKICRLSLQIAISDKERESIKKELQNDLSRGLRHFYSLEYDS